MPMTDAGLKAVIKTEILAIASTATDPELDKFAEALGKAIVQYLLANATIVVNGTVTTGAGAGGTVVGTGTLS